MKRGGPLKRKTPLRAKVSLRDSYLKKLKAQTPRARAYHLGGGRVSLKKSPLKKIAKSRREALKKYFAERNAFLALPGNELCLICVARSLPPSRSTEVHHIRGRAGKLLYDARFFLASCYSCRTWPHDNPREARDLGILAEAKDWNKSPDRLTE